MNAGQRRVSGVADALREGEAAVHTGVPLDLSDAQVINVPGVVADSPCFLPDANLCPFEKFGDVLVAPPATASAGDRVVSTFRGAHPRNDPRLGEGFVEVEREVGGAWTIVARDWDPETRFRWRRTGGALSPMSEVDVEWLIPGSAAPGTYRLVYRGNARSLLAVISPIAGFSPSFEVK